MADAVSMQQVLAEAAVDGLRFDEMQPLPEIWGQEAMSEPAGAGSPGLVRRRLRGKTAPPPAWRDAAPSRPRAAEEPAAKRPAARKRPASGWASEQCPGTDAGEPCVFSQKVAALGGPAQLDRQQGKQRCVWCDAAELAAAVGQPQRRKFLTRALRTWGDHGRQDVVEAAVHRLDPDARALLETALHRAPRTQAAVAARKAAADAAQSWGKLLEARAAVDPPLAEGAKASYRRHLAEDRRRLQAKLPEALAADADGEP